MVRVVLLCLLAGTSASTPAATALNVALISSDNPRHAEVAAALREHLDETCAPPCPHPVELIPVDAADAHRYLASNTPELIVTIGSVAAQAVGQIDTSVPTLFGFIPHTVWRELRDCCVGDAATRGLVPLDQPARRLLRLVRAIHPGAKRVGVLLGPATASRLPELEDAARTEAIQLEAVQIETDDDVGSRLRLLTARVDALLALPDPTVYNRNTIYPILLTTYSARVPVIGYSSAMVKAGAAAGLFMSARDSGDAIAMAIRNYLSHGAFTHGKTTQSYSVEINEEVLRSLRLPAVQAAELPALLGEPTP